MKTKTTNAGQFPEVRILGVLGLPEIHSGDDLARIIYQTLTAANSRLQPGDICVVTQKIVSKSEGALVDLHQIIPSEFAQNIAQRICKDPRLIEVILRESKRIVKMDRDIIICETKHGLVCANAGVDKSNVPGKSCVSLLPADPDRSAAKIRGGLRRHFGIDVPVIIVDTFGRPWREGLTNVAVGVAGLNPLEDLRGRKDEFGYELQKTVMAVADEIASAAELVMKKTERIPVAIIRGYPYQKSDSGSRPLLRPPEKDLFR